MEFARERRLLQMAVGIGCLVPLIAGASGVVEGPAMLKGVAAAGPADLESHFRYLSGLLLGLGVGFALSIPAIERRSELFALLSGIAVIGGFARLGGLVFGAVPSTPHVLALGMELAIVPLLFLWQRRIARRSRFEAGA